MSEPTSAAGSGRAFFGPVSPAEDMIRVMAQLGPVRVIHMSIDPHDSTQDMIRVMAELSPSPPQETQWWWREQISRRVTGLVGATGPSRFTVHLDVPRGELEATARALRAAVVELDAAFASRYEADVQAHLQLARERQEQEQRRFADAQAILDRVIASSRIVAAAAAATSSMTTPREGAWDSPIPAAWQLWVASTRRQARL